MMLPAVYLDQPPPAGPPAGLGASAFAEAIARMEGFYNSAPTIASRNNNPGNLRLAPGRYCQTSPAAGYAAFCTAADGWAALENQISLNAARGLTLYEFFAGKPSVYSGYAPAADNNRPRTYAEFVARALGVSPDSLTADVYGGGGAEEVYPTDTVFRTDATARGPRGSPPDFLSGLRLPALRGGPTAWMRRRIALTSGCSPVSRQQRSWWSHHETAGSFFAGRGIRSPAGHLGEVPRCKPHGELALAV
jgi:hypothetical protein